MRDQYKPCPRCKTNTSIKIEQMNEPRCEMDYWQVYCYNCGFHSWAQETYEKALAAWNNEKRNKK